MKKNKSSKDNQKLVTPLKEKEFDAEILQELRMITDYCNAKRFKKDLRSLFFEFLQYDGSTEAEYIGTLVIGLDQLFDFLDVVEEFQEDMI